MRPGYGCVKNIVDHNMIKLWCECHFIFGFTQPVSQTRGGLRPALFKPTAQLLKTRWLDKNTDSLGAEQTAHIYTPLYINIHYHIVSQGKTLFNLAAQRAVISTRIHFLILHKRSCGNTLTEFIVGQKMIMYPMLFAIAWRPVGGRDRKFKVKVSTFHQTVYDCRLAASRRCRKYDYTASPRCCVVHSRCIVTLH